MASSLYFVVVVAAEAAVADVANHDVIVDVVGTIQCQFGHYILLLIVPSSNLDLSFVDGIAPLDG